MVEVYLGTVRKAPLQTKVYNKTVNPQVRKCVEGEKGELKIVDEKIAGILTCAVCGTVSGHGMIVA